MTHAHSQQGRHPHGDRRIRVLFVMIQMTMGGSERLIFNLVRNMDRRVFEPSIAWFEDSPLAEFKALGVPLHAVPKRGRFDWSTMRRLAAIIREHRIDVVNAHHFLPFFYAYYGAKVANRARLLYTEHAPADVRDISGRWQTFGGLLLRSSDGAIGVSEPVSETLRAHFGLDPQTVHTIENGVDVELFTGDASRARGVRHELGFAADDIVLGHVANFRRNKNHIFLLRAFAEAARGRSDVKLVLVGQGQEGDPENSEPDVRRFIQDAGLGGAVRMLGYRSDVQDVLGMLDVFCLVSYREGLPLSLIEAMASGLPVIGTRVEGIRDVIEHDVNGLMADPDDVPALVAALRRLIDDASLRRRMGDASRQQARDRYSLTRCVRQTEDLMAALVPGRVMPLHVPTSTIA